MATAMPQSELLSLVIRGGGKNAPPPRTQAINAYEKPFLVFAPVPCIIFHCFTQTLVVLALALTIDAESEYVADITSEGIGWAIVVLVGGYIIVALVVLIAKWTDRTKVCAREGRKLEESIVLFGVISTKRGGLM